MGFAEEFDLSLVEGKAVAAGFSGGADSATLLYFLKSRGIPVTALHLNHCLRGEESERDEAFVRAFCEKFGIPLVVCRADVAKAAKAAGESAEECGRRLRYAFFEEERARLEKASGLETVIATAHHQGDQAETLLLNLARGSGPAGLSGIPRIRGQVVRPMLDCPKEEILAYCKENRIPFVEDSSNRDLRYARNRVRLQVLPALSAINPKAGRQIAKTASLLREDEALLSSLADELYRGAVSRNGLLLTPLQHAPKSLSSRAMIRLLKEEGISPDYPLVERALALVFKGGGRLTLPKGKILHAAAGEVRVEKLRPTSDFLGETVLLPPFSGENGPMDLSFAGKGRKKPLKLRVFSAGDWKNTEKIYKNFLISQLDYDTIIGKLNFRSRRAGDWMTPVNRGGKRPVRKLFNEAALTPEERCEALIAEDEEGIVWAEYIGPSQRAAVTEKTRAVLTLMAGDAKEN